MTPPTTIPRPTRIFSTGTLAKVLPIAETGPTARERFGRGERAPRSEPTCDEQLLPGGRPNGGGDKPSPDRGGGASRSVVSRVREFVKLNKKSRRGLGRRHPDRGLRQLPDTIASHLAVSSPDKRAILESIDRQAFREVLGLMERRNLGLQVEKRNPHARQAPDGEDAAEYYLNEQMKAIQKEPRPRTARRDVPSSRIASRRQAQQGSARQGRSAKSMKLRQMSPMSAEATWCATISIGCCHPLQEKIEDQEGPAAARRSRRDHFGLEKVKDASSSTWRCSSAPTS